jgi:hypothetical protein
LWLPTLFRTIATAANKVNNKNTRVLEAKSDGDNLFHFDLPNDPVTSGSFNWKSGTEVQFMFELVSPAVEKGIANHEDRYGVDTTGDGKADDWQPLTADTDGDGVNDEGHPLYAVTLRDKNNLLSLDLWSFLLQDIVRQAGNVSILNNVIDSRKKEQTKLEVIMPSDGNLTVTVLTLDGNVIKYLHRGRESSGSHLYSWDGSNNRGQAVSRGMYFVRVVGPGIDETRKVMVIKE